MSQTILIKKSAVADKAPTSEQLQQGELAVNTADALLYSKHSDGTVVKLTRNALSEMSDDSTHRVTTDTEKSTWNAKCGLVKETSNDGFPTTGDVNTLYVNTTTKLIYLWTGTEYELLGEIPTTLSPLFSVSSVSMNEIDTHVLTIQNYSADNTYTVYTSDSSTAGVSTDGASFIIESEHVASNTPITVKIKSTYPGYMTSAWTEIAVTVNTIIFVDDDAIQIVDFASEGVYNTGWSLI